MSRKRKAPSQAESAKTEVNPRQNGKRSKHEDKVSKAKPGDSSTGRAKTPHRSEAHNALLDEIKALGGDEQDLDLVIDADSDGDEAAQNVPLPVDKKLRKEIANLITDLGLEDHRESSPSSDDVADDVVNRETPPVPVPTILDGKKRRLVLEVRPDWHAVNLTSLPESPSTRDMDTTEVAERLKSHAKQVLDADAAGYESSGDRSSARQFISTIMSSGTTSDKISALTLAIQESPAHNVNAFGKLLGLADTRNRDQAISALGALVDLLGPGLLLPDNRRLLCFGDQPALHVALQVPGGSSWAPGKRLPGGLTDAHLALWYFEDWLKAVYFKVLQMIETWSRDEIAHSRTKALDFTHVLLREKPEQEANLLRLLVNKLGDRDRKISSRASYLVLQLLNAHPNMKSVVISSIEEDSLRTGQAMRTKYYAVNTLNQIILSGNEPDIANTLVRIYFDTFMSLLRSGAVSGNIDTPKPAQGQPAKPDSRPSRVPSAPSRPTNVDLDVTEKLVSSILTGLNRATPFMSMDESILLEHLDTLFRVAHSSNFGTSVQALSLAQRLAASKQVATDRFYRALYESLLDPRLVSSSKQSLYLNVLYKALTSDVDLRRLKAFVKRMLQVLNMHQPSFICATLYLISILERRFPGLRTLLSEPEDTTELTGEADRDVAKEARSDVYDGRKRQPEYSNAYKTCLWEMYPLISHFHPSVSLYASGVMSRDDSLKKPELASHSLIHFLDKFVYKKPKSTSRSHGQSIMQPMTSRGEGEAGLIWGQKVAGILPEPVNSQSFWGAKPSTVAAEDAFFHRYFSRYGKASRDPSTRNAEGPNSAPAVEGAIDEHDEEEVLRALVSTHNELPDDSDGSGAEFGYSDDDDDADDSPFPERDEDEDSDAGVIDALIGSESDSGDDEDGASIEGSESLADSKAVDRQQRRKLLKSLKSAPVFAFADEYEGMLHDGDGS